jgi:heme-degrading monooxygenase HmoA
VSNTILERRQSMPNSILINPFEVPRGQEEEFLRHWQAAAAQMQKAAGFISTRLHQSLDPQAKYRFINVAEWESPQHFQAAMGTEAFQEIARKMPFASYGALYQVIVEMERAMTQRERGKVNINRDSQVPEGSPLPYPAHKIIGILPNEEAAWQAIDELASRGFAEEAIELWRGEAGAQTILDSFRHSGLVGLLEGLRFKYGEEGEISQHYIEDLQAGSFLLVIPAPNAEAKVIVRDSMVKHGGHRIIFFDDLVTETLAP